MLEKPAKGVKGHLLYSPVTQRHFFRVYLAGDKRHFTDYELGAEDIQVEIQDGSVVLRESAESNWVDWSSRVLGRKTE